MKRVELTQGQFTMVDDEDYGWISSYKWYADKDPHNHRLFYARRKERLRNGKQKTITLAREILNAPSDKMVDHINGDTLDNQRSNLRIATHAQNNRNIHRYKGFKGVVWHKRSNKWIARIVFNGKIIHLGYYTDDVEAAKVYDNAALLYFGDFAKTNFPAELMAEAGISSVVYYDGSNLVKEKVN